MPERTVSTAERRRYDRNRDGRGWNQRWRNDSRYDWRRYRDRNRSAFRVGIYYDPFGWDYRRFGIGSYLWPNYYSSNYWINDPWQYRLPPAYGPYRWVRYHNDALLIDTFSGEVVDEEDGKTRRCDVFRTCDADGGDQRRTRQAGGREPDQPGEASARCRRDAGVGGF